MDTFRISIKKDVVFAAAGASADDRRKVAAQMNLFNSRLYSIQSQCFLKNISRDFILKAAEFFVPENYDDVVFERQLQGLCGLPSCPRDLPSPRLLISPADRVARMKLKVEEDRDPYPCEKLESYCSRECLASSLQIYSQLSPIAPFSRLFDGQNYKLKSISFPSHIVEASESSKTTVEENIVLLDDKANVESEKRTKSNTPSYSNISENSNNSNSSDRETQPSVMDNFPLNPKLTQSGVRTRKSAPITPQYDLTSRELVDSHLQRSGVNISDVVSKLVIKEKNVEDAVVKKTVENIPILPQEKAVKKNEVIREYVKSSVYADFPMYDLAKLAKERELEKAPFRGNAVHLKPLGSKRRESQEQFSTSPTTVTPLKESVLPPDLSSTTSSVPIMKSAFVDRPLFGNFDSSDSEESDKEHGADSVVRHSFLSTMMASRGSGPADVIESRFDSETGKGANITSYSISEGRRQLSQSFPGVSSLESSNGDENQNESSAISASISRGISQVSAIVQEEREGVSTLVQEYDTSAPASEVKSLSSSYISSRSNVPATGSSNNQAGFPLRREKSRVRFMDDATSSSNVEAPQLSSVSAIRSSEVEAKLDDPASLSSPEYISNVLGTGKRQVLPISNAVASAAARTLSNIYSNNRSSIPNGLGEDYDDEDNAYEDEDFNDDEYEQFMYDQDFDTSLDADNSESQTDLGDAMGGSMFGFLGFARKGNFWLDETTENIGDNHFVNMDIYNSDRVNPAANRTLSTNTNRDITRLSTEATSSGINGQDLASLNAGEAAAVEEFGQIMAVFPSTTPNTGSSELNCVTPSVSAPSNASVDKTSTDASKISTPNNHSVHQQGVQSITESSQALRDMGLNSTAILRLFVSTIVTPATFSFFDSFSSAPYDADKTILIEEELEKVGQKLMNLQAEVKLIKCDEKGSELRTRLEKEHSALETMKKNLKSAYATIISRREVLLARLGAAATLLSSEFDVLYPKSSEKSTDIKMYISLCDYFRSQSYMDELSLLVSTFDLSHKPIPQLEDIEWLSFFAMLLSILKVRHLFRQHCASCSNLDGGDNGNESTITNRHCEYLSILLGQLLPQGVRPSCNYFAIHPLHKDRPIDICRHQQYSGTGSSTLDPTGKIGPCYLMLRQAVEDDPSLALLLARGEAKLAKHRQEVEEKSRAADEKKKNSNMGSSRPGEKVMEELKQSLVGSTTVVSSLPPNVTVPTLSELTQLLLRTLMPPEANYPLYSHEEESLRRVQTGPNRGLSSLSIEEQLREADRLMRLYESQL